MSKQFNLCGIPRSGQHAIATWLMANLPGPSLFINNSLCIRPDYIWYTEGRRQKFPLKSIPVYEGIGLEGCASLADPTDLPTVFVIRDIKNHVASLVRHPTLHPNWTEFFLDWEEYALLVLGERKKPYEYVVVDFPRWHINENYRLHMIAELWNMLDVDTSTQTYNDDARKDIMGSGGGSSFTGVQYQGCANKMGVLNRWRDVKLPKIPEHILKLNTKVFGDIYN